MEVLRCYGTTAIGALGVTGEDLLRVEQGAPAAGETRLILSGEGNARLFIHTMLTGPRMYVR